jgi:hypothetical protein
VRERAVNALKISPWNLEAVAAEVAVGKAGDWRRSLVEGWFAPPFGERGL